MATRMLVDRGFWYEADGMVSPPGVDGSTPFAELVADTEERTLREEIGARRALRLERPHVHPLGGILLAAWAATAAAFVISVW